MALFSCLVGLQRGRERVVESTGDLNAKQMAIAQVLAGASTFSSLGTETETR